jgi:NADH-quinone oxidoreductase subunit L
MTVPLIVLAVFAVLLGFIGTPVWPWFQSFLGAQHEPVRWGGVIVLMLISSVVVFGGIGVGGLLYGALAPEKSAEKDILEDLQPSIWRVLRDKFYVDELYDATVVRLNACFARLCHWLDRVVLDSLVQLVAYVVLGLSWLNRVVDEYVVNLGFDQVCERLRRGGGFLSRLQNGQVQTYLRVIALALTLFLLLLTWGCSR